QPGETVIRERRARRVGWAERPPSRRTRRRRSEGARHGREGRRPRRRRARHATAIDPPRAARPAARGPGPAGAMTMLENWWRPSASWGCPQLTDTTSVNPLKWNVWNAAVPTGTVTVNDSWTVPPPDLTPVNSTVGAGSNAKNRARSIDARLKG